MFYLPESKGVLYISVPPSLGSAFASRRSLTISL